MNLSALRPPKGSSKEQVREWEAYLRSLLKSKDPEMVKAARKELGV